MGQFIKFAAWQQGWQGHNVSGLGARAGQNLTHSAINIPVITTDYRCASADSTCYNLTLSRFFDFIV